MPPQVAGTATTRQPNQTTGRGLPQGAAGEVLEATTQGTAMVVEHAGRISGNCTALAFFGHAVGESIEDLKTLIASGRSFDGPGILVPAHNSALLPWCLQNGLQIVQVMTLMSMGLYNEPMGAYMPSVLY